MSILGQVRTYLAILTRITCLYCIDIGSALARHEGITEAQLRELPSYLTGDEFADTEVLVLDVAKAMTRTPSEVPDELRQRQLQRFTPAAIIELMATIAWENHRGRLNQALGVRPSGFSDGMVCAVPEVGT